MTEPLVGPTNPAAHLIADKGYDSDAFRSFLRQQQLTPVIPARRNRLRPESTDWCLYAARHGIENLFNKLKHFRALASRYDKTVLSFTGMIALASIVIWLRL